MPVVSNLREIPRFQQDAGFSIRELYIRQSSVLGFLAILLMLPHFLLLRRFLPFPLSDAIRSNFHEGRERMLWGQWMKGNRLQPFPLTMLGWIPHLTIWAPTFRYIGARQHPRNALGKLLCSVKKSLAFRA